MEKPPLGEPDQDMVDMEVYSAFRRVVEAFNNQSKDVFATTGLNPFGKLLSEDPSVTPEESQAALSYLFSGKIDQGDLFQPPDVPEELIDNMLAELEQETPGILERAERRLQMLKQFEEGLNQPRNNPETS